MMKDMERLKNSPISLIRRIEQDISSLILDSSRKPSLLLTTLQISTTRNQSQTIMLLNLKVKD